VKPIAAAFVSLVVVDNWLFDHRDPISVDRRRGRHPLDWMARCFARSEIEHSEGVGRGVPNPEVLRTGNDQPVVFGRRAVDEPTKVAVPQLGAIAVNCQNTVLVGVSTLRLASLLRIAVACYKGDAAIVSVGVVRIGVQRFTVDLGWNGEIDAPLLAAARTE